MNALHIAGPAAAALVVFMGLAWHGARRADNAGWVDVAWSYSFLIVVSMCLWLGDAPLVRKAVVCAMLTLWSLRLGTYLALRVGRDAREDPRYATMRALLGPRPWNGFFWFFQAQALSVVVLATPFFLAASNTTPFPAPIEVAGILIFAAGLGGEALADAQLAAFRRHPANRGKVCDAGLWKFSRHPNYFFEWVIWIGFGCVGMAAPGGIVAIVSPLIMLILLTRVTGIPPAEARSLASRGAAYRDYQRRTSPFIPWPPRKDETPRGEMNL